MTCKIEAVYEHGVLRPLEPLVLTESQRVTLSVSDVVSGTASAAWESWSALGRKQRL